MKRIALYPGTFDPITNGHFDVIERALGLFDELIVAVATSQDKQPMFTLDERIKMIQTATAHLKNIRIVGFDNLTVELAKTHKITLLVKGPYDYISNGEQLKINRTGCPEMSMGGTGDVLAGLCACFLTTNNNPFHSACSSAFFNGFLLARDLQQWI